MDKKIKIERENKTDFINSREGRIVRIASEFLEAKTRLEKEQIKNTIVLFGSARINDPKVAKKELDQAKAKNLENIAEYEDIYEISQYYEKARLLSYKLAIWSKTLAKENKFYLCSGGGGGIMEACNRGACEADEKNIGFNIKLPFEQKANPYIDEDLIFDFHYFFIRKFWFSYLAKAFIVFPGGFGTMDELFEVLTLLQTQKMKKNIPVVFIGTDFFNKVLNIELFEKYGLISKNDKNIFIITDDVEEAFKYVTETVKPWIV